jgi:UDP-N-acetylglucosamine diphosphorylase/glucosamine-1-phosphate N-acetyltransferase
MRLILFDGPDDKRADFYPLSLSRPVWALRSGMSTLAEKLLARTGAGDVACFVPDYMAAAYRERTAWPVNDASALRGDDLLAVNGRLKADGLDLAPEGAPEVGLDADGDVLYVRCPAAEAEKLAAESLDAFLASAKRAFPAAGASPPAWGYPWDLVLANGEQIAADFRSAGRHGLEGSIEQPTAVRGAGADVYVAPTATVHPMVVIDAEHGPVYVDEGAEIHPFTRIEGPCYVGPGSVLLGAKCREGNTIGPVCRVGGEVEESILLGYTNKYHDGFLGHAYVGEWVNLGALTTNSDLKNDYGTVAVTPEGRPAVDTGSTKVGSIIGDHTKTSIGVLLNTGAYVGAMCLLLAAGRPLPKTIPSFAWVIEGVASKGFGRRKLYETAKLAMGRRGRRWTPATAAMWEAVHEITAGPRTEAIRRGRRRLRA